MSSSTSSALVNRGLYSPPSEWSGGLPPDGWVVGRTFADQKPLPALSPGASRLDPERQAVLLALYGEVCSGWRMLTEVRFKLLGLLPVVSVAVLITLLSSTRGPTALHPIETTTVAALGLLLTGAVWLYDRRNTMLYDDLVGRGRQIEAELGVYIGHFRGRPKSRGLIQHDVAMRTVYTLSAIAWALAAVQPWIGLTPRATP